MFFNFVETASCVGGPEALPRYMVRCAGFDDPKLIPPAVTYPPYLPSVLAGVSRLSAADVCFRGVSTTFGP